MADTDPLWYALAVSLAPRTLGTTAKRGWVEGFVEGLAVALERGVEIDFGEVLLSGNDLATVGVEPEEALIERN